MARAKSTSPTATAGSLSAAQIADSVNKKFGSGTMVPGIRAMGLVRPRISTGSLALDLALSGGYPEGAVTLFEGAEGTSKSWNLHNCAANFLRLHKDGIYVLINAEGTNDPPFLEMLGVDLGRTYFVQPDSGENAWDVAHEIAAKAKKVFIGVDSLDAMVPLQEMEGDMDEHKMAPAARMNNKGFRKLIALMRSDIESQEHRVTMGIITQLRTNIGVIWGDNQCTVGGKGKNFAAMTIIRYRKVRVVRTEEGKTILDKIAYAMEIEAEIIKNKGAGEGEKVRFTLYKENHEGFRRGQIDNVTELLPFLLRYKIVEIHGSMYVLEDGTKHRGKAQFELFLRENDSDRERLISRVRAEIARRHASFQEEAPVKKRVPAKVKFRASAK